MTIQVLVSCDQLYVWLSLFPLKFFYFYFSVHLGFDDDDDDDYYYYFILIIIYYNYYYYHFYYNTILLLIFILLLLLLLLLHVSLIFSMILVL